MRDQYAEIERLQKDAELANSAGKERDVKTAERTRIRAAKLASKVASKLAYDQRTKLWAQQKAELAELQARHARERANLEEVLCDG